MSLSNEDRQFWHLVFEDHILFIYDALGKGEVELIETVKALYNNAVDYDEIEANIPAIMDLKREILARILTKSIDISLDATFLNHMINEGEAALNPSTHVLQDHKLWLLDAEGHLTTIKKMLDPVEKVVIRELKNSCKQFKLLFTKTLEFIGYLRSGLYDFPALQSLTDGAQVQLDIYFELLRHISASVQNGQVLGHIKPLMLDHMLREQSFYLHKLGLNSELKVAFGIRGVGVPETL